MKLLIDIKPKEDLQVIVFEHFSYRSLLRALFSALKQFDRKYSYRFFSKLYGLKSPGYIQSILNGKRNLSDELLGKILRTLGFSPDEREYVELLVRTEKIGFANPLYPVYKTRLQEIRSKNLKLKTVELAQYECVSSWVHWVIRELFLLKGAGLDLKWIKDRLKRFLPLSGKQIQKCLDDLKEAGLIKIKGNEVEVPDPILRLDAKSLPTLLKQYHSEAILQSAENLALRKVDREYGSVIVATTKNKFENFKQKLQKDRSDALQLLSVAPGEAELLVSFNFQFFPVADTEED